VCIATGIVGSNPSRSMGVGPLFFCVVLSCVRRVLQAGRSPVQVVCQMCKTSVRFRRILNWNRPNTRKLKKEEKRRRKKKNSIFFYIMQIFVDHNIVLFFSKCPFLLHLTIIAFLWIRVRLCVCVCVSAKN
jgi:hypothetical protein